VTGCVYVHACKQTVRAPRIRRVCAGISTRPRSAATVYVCVCVCICVCVCVCVCACECVLCVCVCARVYV